MENYLPCYEKSFCERTEKNITCEIDLQEYLPNASKVIKVTANAVCEECEVLRDSINVRGTIKFSAVYLSDFRDRLKCAVGECEFSHSFPAKGIDEAVGDSGAVECNAAVFEEKGQVISQRKLSVSCRAVVSVQAITVRQTEIFDTTEDDGVHKLSKDVGHMHREMLPGCNTTLEENISLDDGMPEIREIVSSECSISSVSATCNDGRVKYTGSVLLNCLYLGGNENEEEYVCFSKELDFSAESDADGIPDGSFLVCKAHIDGVNADAAQNNYGEMTVCNVSIGVCLSATAYGVYESRVVCDAFCTIHDCSCEIKNIAYDCFISGTSEKAEVTENVRANLGSMTDIVSKSANVNVVSAELSGKVPVFNMRAVLKIMGTNEQGSLECINASFPIKVVSAHELAEIPDRYKCDATAYVNSCECRIENGEIVCILHLEIYSCIYARTGTAAVTAMVIDTDTEIQRKKSEYILYYPEKNDSVWACAKKYRVSPSALAESNEMSLLDTDFGDRRVVVIPTGGI